MLLGILPLAGSVSAADGGSAAAPVDITFTITTIESISDGEFTGDDANFSIRNSSTSEAVEGDITGTAIITLDGDFHAAGECTDEACPGNIDGWEDVEITDEAGSWEGTIAFQIDDVAGTELGKVFLVGRGGNAGKAIVGDQTYSEEIDNSVIINGQMVTMTKPSQGVKIYYDGCFIPPAQTGGAMLMTVGGQDDAGSWAADYPILIPGHATFGESTITTARGTVDSVLMLESNGSTRNGYFMLLGGTGEYEHLYGFGIVRTSAYESGHCPDAAGAGGYWIGQTFAN